MPALISTFFDVMKSFHSLEYAWATARYSSNLSLKLPLTRGVVHLEVVPHVVVSRRLQQLAHDRLEPVVAIGECLAAGGSYGRWCLVPLADRPHQGTDDLRVVELHVCQEIVLDRGVPQVHADVPQRRRRRRLRRVAPTGCPRSTTGRCQRRWGSHCRPHRPGGRPCSSGRSPPRCRPGWAGRSGWFPWRRRRLPPRSP